MTNVFSLYILWTRKKKYGLLLIIISFIWLIYVNYGYFYAAYFHSIAVKTTGTIVSVHILWWARTPRSIVTIKFLTLDGRQIIFNEDPITNCAYQTGKEVEVMYNPSNPKIAYIVYYVTNEDYIIDTILSLIAYAVAVFLLRKPKSLSLV